GAGWNAFRASQLRTIESFPPLNSRTGRSNCAATSRRTWIDSDSSARRWVRVRLSPRRNPRRARLLPDGAHDRRKEEPEVVGARVGEPVSDAVDPAQHVEVPGGPVLPLHDAHLLHARGCRPLFLGREGLVQLLPGAEADV